MGIFTMRRNSLTPISTMMSCLLLVLFSAAISSTIFLPQQIAGEMKTKEDLPHSNISKGQRSSSEGSVNIDLYEHWANSILMQRNHTTTSQDDATISRRQRSVCKISEFVCRGGKCIATNRFCDGVDDCGDGSDEPRFCTPCNRTYYGEWGSTYTLSLSSATIAAALGLSHEQQILLHGQQSDPSISSSPLQQTLPSSSGAKKQPHNSPQFVCQLTFAAAGDSFGDLVQIMFDSLNIGHFASPTTDGCPDGSLQVAEINRPLTGGKWCGSGQGYAVYFSEMSAIALTLSVGNLASVPQTQQRGISESNMTLGVGIGGTNKKEDSKPPGAAADDFQFKIRYKFIPRSMASVRFGSHGAPIERGEVVPGSYCSRDFESCHRRRCKIQSPNYPGVYPRNVTCHFTIRHREQQPCKHVLVQVSQDKAHKVQIKGPSTGRQPSTGVQGGNTPHNVLMQEDTMTTWEDCQQRDSLTIYDGTSIYDPVLLVICGGAVIPPVTSSNSELLVIFRATPFGNPMELRPPSPLPQPLRGFELNVNIIMVDSDSSQYSNYKDNCTFFFVSQPSDKCLLFKPQEQGGNWITGKRGRVTNPRHTITPNTTCRYEFKGSKHETVWIYFVSFSRGVSKEGRNYDGNCSSRLTIKDGIDGRNEALIGNYCEPDLPKLCDHKALLNDSRIVRSCTESESYISAGSRLIVEQTFFQGTVLRPINYQIHYEFVSRHMGTDGSCNRHYNLSKMKPKGSIKTSDNVFDFGRGGKSTLNCTYTFSLGSYDGLRLSVKGSSFGDRACRTLTDLETGRYICNYIAQPKTFSNETSPQGSNRLMNSPPDVLPKSELSIEEYIWGNLNISSHRHCLCSNLSGGPVFTFLGRRVQLRFTVEGMNARDSYENFFVHFDYEIVKGDGCRGDNHHMRTPSGLIVLDSTFSHGVKPPSCDIYPWLLEAKDNHSLYLRIPGFPMLEEKRIYQQSNAPQKHTAPVLPQPTHGSEETPEDINGNTTVSNTSINTSISWNPGDMLPGLTKFQIDRICPTTKNRILIYDGDNRLVQKICPASVSSMNIKTPSQIVEIYSEDFGKFHSPLFPPPKTRFIIEFVGRELGSYQVKWLELISAKMKTTLKAMEYDPPGSRHPNNISVISGGEHDQLRRGTPPWDETLNKMFEGVNGESERSESAPSAMIPGEKSSLGSSICTSYCPELRACISESLWCDGEIHCPTTEADEKSCDTFWATMNQFLSPAVYIPLLAAIASAFCCCGLVMMCVAVKKMVLNMRSKGQLGQSTCSSRTSTVDRRTLGGHSRDYFYDPHEPIS